MTIVDGNKITNEMSATVHWVAGQSARYVVFVYISEGNACIGRGVRRTILRWFGTWKERR